MIRFIYLSAFLVLISFSNSFSQSVPDFNSLKFGLKAGYSSISARVSANDFSVSNNGNGFYIGAFGEFFIQNQFYFQPELLYANFSDDGESSDVLILTLLFKYKPAKKIGLLFGPQFDFLLNEEDTRDLKILGIGVAVGAAYEITDNIILDAKYSFGINDRLQDSNDFNNLKAKISYFQIGLAYRF